MHRKRGYIIWRIAPLLILFLLGNWILAENPKRVRESSAEQRANEAIIFCLHDIGGKGKYSLSKEDFSELLSLLHKKYEVSSLRDFLRRDKSDSQKKTVVLTFDDGYAAHIDEVVPVLTRMGMGATFYLYLDKFGKRAKAIKKYSQLSEIFEIGSHGISHEQSLGWDTETFFKEVYVSRKQLEFLTGKEITSWAWPYGDFEEGQPELVFSAGYTAQVSTAYRTADKTKDQVLPRFTLMQPDPVLQAKNILELYESR